MKERLARWVRSIRGFLPADRREWIDALAVEIAPATSGREALRWAFGAIPVMVFGLASALVSDVRGGGVAMRSAVAVVATGAVLGGVALGLVFAFAPDVPPLVLGLALGLVTQGGYTLAYLAGLLDRFQPAARRLLLVGNAVAAIVGSIAFVTGGVRNLHPETVDPEYGPMTVALLITTLGVATLVTFVRRSSSA